MQTLNLDGDFRVTYPCGHSMPETIKYVQSIKTALLTHDPMLNHPDTQINLWCRGSSGAILAALFCLIVAPQANIRVLHVKKSGEEAHEDRARPFYGTATDIIIDDFMDKGHTIKAIITDAGINKIDYLIVAFINEAARMNYFLDKRNLLPAYLVSNRTQNEIIQLFLNPKIQE